MFYYAGVFNQPIGAWNVSAVTDMYQMFYYAYTFDQPIGNWNVTAVISMDDMFYDDNMSVYNYDNLLLGWSKEPVYAGLSFDAGYSQYDGTALAARTILTTDDTWSISDGGEVTVAPGPSASLVATSGNQQVALTWSVPVDNGGTPITNYTIYEGTAAGDESPIVTVGNVTSRVVLGLTNGVTYYFTVAAVNAIGTGVNSSVVNATPITVPGAPQRLVAAAGNGQVVLTWTAPSADGGSAITGYKIYMGTAAGAETLLATVGNVLAYTATGLTNGKTYYFTVSAINAAGEGVKSTEASAKPSAPAVYPPPIPGYPNGLLLLILVSGSLGLAVAVHRRRPLH
jgi:surface protein